MRPESTEYAPFYAGYIEKVPETDIRQTFTTSLDELTEYLEFFTEENADYAYAVGKWTMKQLLQHIIDTERIFAYRALCIVRGEKQAIPGFDENEYADQTISSSRSIAHLKEELLLLRKANALLFQGISDADMLRKGIVNQNSVTVRAIAYMMIGHIRHHIIVVKERYLGT